MHFTIIQAETCDKVKIIIIFNNILFSFFSFHFWGRTSLLLLLKEETKTSGWIHFPQTHFFQLIKISWMLETKSDYKRIVEFDECMNVWP